MSMRERRENKPVERDWLGGKSPSTGLVKESDQGLMTVSIKADKETKMGIITEIKQELRRAYALKISYAATQRTSY